MRTFVILASALVLVGMSSCRKDYNPRPGNVPPTRIVQFELYTDQDFSEDAHNITFNLRIENADKVIFDSALATMKIQDIPNELHKIIIRKSVPQNDPSTLKVGFVYHIENVGISWHFEEFPSSDALKVVKFDFR
jgi:hypothetical protein